MTQQKKSSTPENYSQNGKDLIIFINHVQMLTREGKVLKSAVNGSLLKKYFDRQNWEPIIII